MQRPRKTTRRKPQERNEDKKSASSAAAKAATKQPKLRWQIAADAIVDNIRAGRYPEGSRIPAENSIADELGINRHTVRRAIAELQKRGILRSNPLGGSLVAPHSLQLPLDSSERFADTLTGAGFQNRGQLLTSKVAEKPVPADVAEALGRPVQAALMVFDHVHLANELPFSLITTWVSADRFRRVPDVYAVTGHLDDAFAQLGVRGYRRQKAVISCRAADQDECRLLSLDEGAVLLVLKMIYCDIENEPVSYSIFRYAADRVEFVVHTDRGEGASRPSSSARRR